MNLSKQEKYVAYFCSLLLVIYTLIVGVNIDIFEEKRDSYDGKFTDYEFTQDESYIMQIKEDWKSHTWTDLIVTFENCPSSHPKNLFF